MPPTTNSVIGSGMIESPQARVQRQCLDRMKIIHELFGDVHLVRVGTIIFRCQAFARRLMEFGFEDYLNLYEPRELLLLASFMPERQQVALIREAFAKGPQPIRDWITAYRPGLCQP